MKIITCYKCVPDEQDIAINNADGTLDFSKADGKISQYDLNAIEAACQLKQQVGEAQVVAMSVGGKALTNAKGRKDVLSRGPLTINLNRRCRNKLPLRWLPPCKNPVLICLFAATVLPIFMLSRLVCWWAKCWTCRR